MPSGSAGRRCWLLYSWAASRASPNSIYILRILDRVPLLQGLDPLPVLVFSFFEYVLYWALVAWLALGLFKIG